MPFPSSFGYRRPHTFTNARLGSALACRRAFMRTAPLFPKRHSSLYRAHLSAPNPKASSSEKVYSISFPPSARSYADLDTHACRSARTVSSFPRANRTGLIELEYENTQA